MTKSLFAALALSVALASLSSIPAKAFEKGFASHDASGEFDKRRKPRIPGGSGCDDPEDVIEHPECR
jgi:hypothetical protein